jgi:hypothetical protein
LTSEPGWYSASVIKYTPCTKVGNLYPCRLYVFWQDIGFPTYDRNANC